MNISELKEKLEKLIEQGLGDKEIFIQVNPRTARPLSQRFLCDIKEYKKQIVVLDYDSSTKYYSPRNLFK